MKKIIHYITYGDDNYQIQTTMAKLSARIFNRFSSIEILKPQNIEKCFYNKYNEILDSPRGGGFWLWKPYFIKKKLNEICDGEYLVYSDAGLFFVKSIDAIFDNLPNNELQDVIAFELPLIEKQWTKRELFNIDEGRFDRYKDTHQIMASVIIFKKSLVSMKFVKEWLRLCCHKEYITDVMTMKQSNYFIGHRHDQSLFSLLYKEYGFRPYKDPTQLGAYPSGYSGLSHFFAQSGKYYLLENGRYFMAPRYDYDFGTVLYRCRNSNPIIAYIKFNLKKILFKFRLYSGCIR